MYKDIVGQNILTVLVTKPIDSENIQLKMFFDPYSKSHTMQYRGQVLAIYPGFDIEETPQFIIRPQRLDKNIHYSFREVKTDGDVVDFWIQDQYFMDDPVKTYYCYNCQAPQLYFNKDKVVFFQSKADLKRGESYQCINPLCKENLKFMGIVQIKDVHAML